MLKTENGLDNEDFEVARSCGLPVCDKAISTTNRQVANLLAAVRAPLLAEIKRLHAELDALRSAKQDAQPAKGVPLALLIELRVLADVVVNDAPVKHMRSAMDARNGLDVILAPMLAQEVAVL